MFAFTKSGQAARQVSAAAGQEPARNPSERAGNYGVLNKINWLLGAPTPNQCRSAPQRKAANGSLNGSLSPARADLSPAARAGRDFCRARRRC